MNFQAIETKPKMIETVFHDFQRCHLFRNKQHRFAVPQRVSDDVRNGLGFARSGWSLNDEVLAGRGVNHSAELRGIGVGYERRSLLLKLWLIDIVHGRYVVGEFTRHIAVNLS